MHLSSRSPGLYEAMMTESRGFSGIDGIPRMNDGSGDHLAIVFGIEEEGIQNGLIVTITAFISITAFPAERKLIPALPELATHPAIRRSQPDALKAIILDITQGILLSGIVGAGTD